MLTSSHNSFLSYNFSARKYFSQANITTSKPQNFVSDIISANQKFSRPFFRCKESRHFSTKPTAEIDSDEHFKLGSQFYDQKDFVNAVAHFKAGAEKNHLDCLNSYALCFYNGHGVKQDFSEALKYFQIAADKGHKEAQYNCGSMHMTGKGHKVDLQKAANYLKLSADQGNGDACFFYAYLLMGGIESESSESKSAEKETKEDIFIRTGKKAFEYLSKGSKLGNPACQCSYGVALFLGEGINPDKRKGVELIKKSCEKGYARALNFYGNLLNEGVTIFEKSNNSDNNNLSTAFPVKLIDKDEKEAAKLFGQAASHFDPEGCYNYGLSLLNGKGVPKNTRKALVFIKKAAQLGFPEAICELATFFEKGIEVQKDVKKAAQLYKQAADNGSQSAVVHYGHMCMDGIGVEKNVVEATKYFKLAMRNQQ